MGKFCYQKPDSDSDVGEKGEFWGSFNFGRIWGVVKVVWVIVGEGTRMRRKYPGVWNGVGARGGGGAKGNEDECETSGSPLKIEKANRR